MSERKEPVSDKTLDASGMPCPLPLLKAKLALNGILPGETLKVICTDAGSQRDFQVFARISGHRMLEVRVADGWLRKDEGGI